MSQIPDQAVRASAGLLRKFASKKYRDAFVDAHTRAFLAGQIRAMRGDMTQKEFGRRIAQRQSVVSQLENERKSVTLRTLLNIAKRLDLALVVRFVDHSQFVEMTRDMSEAAFTPQQWQQDTKAGDVPSGACFDCGLAYKDPGFADLIVPHDVWAKISPTGHDGGLLCPTCLVRRAAKAGIECRAEFRSGPFALLNDGEVR